MDKKSLFGRDVRAIPVFLAVFACAAITQASSFLLRVDVSSPSAVTITATGEFPEVDDSATTTFYGVTLLDFFASAELGGSTPPLSSSNLQPAGTGVSYTSWTVDNYSGTYVDLNVFESVFGSQQIFTTSAAAFTGTASLDLSGYSLRGSGATGNILAGYSGYSGAVIGEYYIVPEPHAFPLAAGFGLIAFVWMRRRFSR